MNYYIVNIVFIYYLFILLNSQVQPAYQPYNPEFNMIWNRNRLMKRHLPEMRNNRNEDVNGIMDDTALQDNAASGSCGGGCGGSGCGSGSNSKTLNFNPMQSHFNNGNKNCKDSGIAQSAAQEAEAAQEAQTVAGQLASHQVKSQLAEKAMQAAKAAEAVLIGKKAIVEQIEQEIREAETVVIEVSASVQQAKENVRVAVQAAQQSKQQLKTLTIALETAKDNVSNAEKAAEGSQKELCEKTQLIEAAKKRVEQLNCQLRSAREDCRKTKESALKASKAAQEARTNAERNKRMMMNRMRYFFQ